MSSIVYQARPSLTRNVREGLADVISIHEMLTNQILLFHFETAGTLLVQDLRLNTGAVLGLQIKHLLDTSGG